MFVDEKDIRVFEMGEGKERRVMKVLGHGKNLMGVTTHFKLGCYAKPHIHTEHEQFIMVLRGKFELLCGGEKRILKAGECYYAEPGVSHDARCLEDNSVLLDVNTPLRMDLLNEEE